MPVVCITAGPEEWGYRRADAEYANNGITGEHLGSARAIWPAQAFGLSWTGGNAPPRNILDSRAEDRTGTKRENKK